MKTIWNILAVIAIANLLALAGFVGWLRMTDRMSVDRLREIREKVSKTITQENTEFEQAKAKVEADQKAAEAAAKAAKAPLTAEQRLAARGEATELDRLRAERLQREVDDLKRGLQAEREKLSREQAALDAERKAFQELVQGSQDAVANAQFQKSLGVLSTLKPAVAATMIQQLISGAADPNSLQPVPAPGEAAAANQGGPSPKPAPNAGFTQAVSYLDAMDDRPRGKIMAEFAKTDPALATRLLERLRKRGDLSASASTP